MATNPNIAAKALAVSETQLETIVGGGSVVSGDNTFTADTATLYLTPETIESYTISSWTALSNSSPFTYQATVTATATIGNDTIVELFNDQALLFAEFGFVIGNISSQSITFYSIGEPSSDVTLKVRIGG